MKHYTFNLTKKEVLEFSIQTVLERMKRRPVFWIIFLLIFILNIQISLRGGLIIMLCMLSFIILFILQTYLLMKKEFHEAQRSIWVENAMLKMSLDIYNEIPLNDICTIRKSRHMIMLEDQQSEKRIIWYPIPFRVFESSKEQEIFLESIQHPQQETSEDRNSFEMKNEGRELFHFLPQLNDEKWVQLLKDERAIRATKTLGKEKKHFTFLIIYVFFVILFALSGVLKDITQILTISVFMIILMVLFWLKIIYGNPEKKMRRQLKSGLLQKHIYKGCKISVFEHGVMIDSAEKRKSIMPWDTLGWLVETEFAFYLFKKDKVCYVIVPKKCLENWGQAVAMCRLCEGKGIPVLRGRKMKYTPNWIFYLLAFFVVIVYTQVSLWFTWLTAMYSNLHTIEQIHDFGVEENMWIEEFNPADYPDYVPLDIQVEVLRSLGFTVPQEVADWEQKCMDEYDMQVYVEGYPYTELLSVLGMPTYNDEYEIIGYSDEVLWFDFEGMDTRMDYIGILEGMEALAAGSCIDNVSNIQEDMSEVDWESGTGKITISFEWQGCEYICQMDVENDWIDEEILGVFNSLLKQNNAEERFYITGDNGQGALVFFGTADWAVEFEKATGLDLDFYTSPLNKL